jgi:hypothetical protein
LGDFGFEVRRVGRMLEIRYSGAQEVDLAGSRIELEELRNALLGLINGELSELRFEADRTIDPTPWDSVGQALDIQRGGDAVRVSIAHDSTMVIEASDENLNNFASFLYFDETAESGSHSHFEFYEGNDCVTPDSIPLVISVK